MTPERIAELKKLYNILWEEMELLNYGAFDPDFPDREAEVQRAVNTAIVDKETPESVQKTIERIRKTRGEWPFTERLSPAQPRKPRPKIPQSTEHHTEEDIKAMLEIAPQYLVKLDLLHHGWSMSVESALREKAEDLVLDWIKLQTPLEVVQERFKQLTDLVNDRNP